MRDAVRRGLRKGLRRILIFRVCTVVAGPRIGEGRWRESKALFREIPGLRVVSSGSGEKGNAEKPSFRRIRTRMICVKRNLKSRRVGDASVARIVLGRVSPFRCRPRRKWVPAEGRKRSSNKVLFKLDYSKKWVFIAVSNLKWTDFLLWSFSKTRQPKNLIFFKYTATCKIMYTGVIFFFLGLSCSGKKGGKVWKNLFELTERVNIRKSTLLNVK